MYAMYGAEAEIIVVDDGSHDATADEAVKADNGSGLVRIIKLEHNMGKGCAVKIGMLAAKGRLRLFVDADGATPIAEYQKLYLLSTVVRILLWHRVQSEMIQEWWIQNYLAKLLVPVSICWFVH
jgi:glycosyltransferase involved in cell wall biosynthesis